MGFIRHLYHNLLRVPGIPFFFRFARRDCATIFMMHRFTHRDRCIEGFDPGQLRKGLEYLRRNDYEFLSLTELFHRMEGNPAGLNGSVLFTIDDGYIDHAEVAAPVFAEFDCPVTTFATTGFLDRKLWMWWNKVEFIFLKTGRRSIEAIAGGESITYSMDGDANVLSSQEAFIERCKLLDDDEKCKAIASLAENAEVDLPEAPPVMYAPMTWDQARECEKRGMTFGPHTVTHPVLSRTTAARSEWEITESWNRLRAEVKNPVPVFCYPNGQLTDFGPREIGIFRKLGLSGAVVGVPGFAGAQPACDNDCYFKVPRLSYPENLSDLIQYVSGIERCKQMIRSRI